MEPMSKPDPKAEWWTTTEVAAYIGVSVSAVTNYRKRHLLPEPDQSLGRTHLWSPERIIDWQAGRPRPGVGGRPRGKANGAAVAAYEVPTMPRGGASQWLVHGERVLYDNPWARLSLVDVEQPTGRRYESHVVTLPPAAIVALVDEESDRVLMMWRHRFAPDLWSWELPGGVVEENEPPSETASREAVEETGFRPLRLEQVSTFEPMVGQVRSPHYVFIGWGVEHVGKPTETTESDGLEWIPIGALMDLIRSGGVATSGALVAILYLLASRT
jgi:8-oxo-dGTP pyrophosphatase MutT (NUDIX family)